jgi:hypothetical protein
MDLRQTALWHWQQYIDGFPRKPTRKMMMKKMMSRRRKHRNDNTHLMY